MKATSVGAWANSFTAIYETDPELIAAVLPPPLEPTDQPLVRVSIASVDLGAGRPPFGAGTFAVQAKHEGTIGNYPLVMPMTTEQSVVGGRETFGEPKKLAAGRARPTTATNCRGTVTRLGTTFIELTGRVTGDLEPPAERERIDFYFKFLPAPDGKGFDTEPALIYCHRQETARKVESVDGEIILRESRFDPVFELPVRAHRRDDAVRAAQRADAARSSAACPSEWLVPYAHQRYDDMSPDRRQVTMQSFDGQGRGRHGRSERCRPGHGRALRASGHARRAGRRRGARARPDRRRAEGRRHRRHRRRHRRVRLRVRRAPARQDAGAASEPSTSCATTPASAPGPRATCGTTRSTTGAGRST